MKIYEMKVYGILYHREATTIDKAKKKLQAELSKRYSSPVPLSHIKLIDIY